MSDRSPKQVDENIDRLLTLLAEAAARPSQLPVPLDSNLPRRKEDESSASPLEQLDRRIAQAGADEAIELLLVRKKLVEQVEEQEDRKHTRAFQGRNFYAKVALSFGALGVGTALVFGGFAMPGFVCIGAGLYAIAPSFIDRVTDHVLGRKKP